MEIKPPTKPGKNADEKALLAYHSELRRYHRMLEAWDAKLRQQETTEKAYATAWSIQKIERRKEIITSAGKPKAPGRSKPIGTLVGPDCGCSIEAACDGCDCPECIQWRKDYKITEDMVGDWSVQEIVKHAKQVHMAKQAESAPAPVTDEMSKFFAKYEEQMANPQRDDEQR